MSRELPPIAKIAMRLLVAIEDATGRFPHRHKFRLGADLRNLATKHKVPPAEKPFESMKGSELKAWMLASPGHITAPKILVDLYGKIEKPDRYGFLA